jgi:hypothetical protein
MECASHACAFARVTARATKAKAEAWLQQSKGGI